MNKDELLIALQDVLDELDDVDDGTLQALRRIEAVKAAKDYIEEEATDSDWF